MHSSIASQLALPLMLSLAFYSLPAQSNDFSPYFKLDSFTYSETVSIRDTLNDWEGDTFNKGKRQWTWNWAEAGIRYKHFSIGFLYRVDYDLRFTEDLAELYWLTENKKDLPTGRTYNTRLSADAFRARGYRFAYHDTFAGNLSFSAGLSYLSAYYMIEGDIQGNATATAENDYQFELGLDYRYTKDTLFDREVEKPTGRGFTLDAAITYQITPHDQLQIQVSDLYGVITWEDTPVTTGVANSDRTGFDENGYAKIRPLLSGNEGLLESFEQKLEPRWYFEYQRQFDQSLGLQFKVRQQYNHALYAIGGSYKKRGAWGFDYWIENQLVELSWAQQALKLSLGTDSLSKNHAKQFWLSFTYAVGR